jgi:hypothetical protein
VQGEWHTLSAASPAQLGRGRRGGVRSPPPTMLCKELGGPISSAANSEVSTPDGVDTDTTIILGDLSVAIENQSEPAGEVLRSQPGAPAHEFFRIRRRR